MLCLTLWESTNYTGLPCDLWLQFLSSLATRVYLPQSRAVNDVGGFHECPCAIKSCLPRVYPWRHACDKTYQSKSKSAMETLQNLCTLLLPLLDNAEKPNFEYLPLLKWKTELSPGLYQEVDNIKNRRYMHKTGEMETSACGKPHLLCCPHLFTWLCISDIFTSLQAHRQWGSLWSLLLASKRFYIHRLTVHFKCPTIWKWSTSLAIIIENHHFPNRIGYSYVSWFMEISVECMHA